MQQITVRAVQLDDIKADSFGSFRLGYEAIEDTRQSGLVEGFWGRPVAVIAAEGDDAAQAGFVFVGIQTDTTGCDPTLRLDRRRFDE